MNITELADGRVLLTYASETGDSTNVNNLVYRIIDPRDPLLNGTAGNDVITATPNDSTINGVGGDDKLIGQGGNDILNGGATVMTHWMTVWATTPSMAARVSTPPASITSPRPRP